MAISFACNVSVDVGKAVNIFSLRVQKNKIEKAILASRTMEISRILVLNGYAFVVLQCGGSGGSSSDC